jgi:hypothetical protein
LLVGAGLYAGGSVIAAVVGVAGWVSLVVVAAACVVLGVALAVSWGMTGDERRAAVAWFRRQPTVVAR